MIHMLKALIIILVMSLLACQSEPTWKEQTELEYFQKAGTSYLSGQYHRSLLQVKVGLKSYPNSKRLELLKKRIEQVLKDEKEKFSVNEPPPEQDQENEDQNNSSGGEGQSSGGDGQSSGGEGQSSGGEGQSSGGEGQSSGGEGQSSGGEGQSSGGDGQSSGGEGQSSAANSISSGAGSSSNSQEQEQQLNQADSSAPLSEEEKEELQMEYIEREAAKQFLDQFKDNESKRKHRRYKTRPGQKKDW